MATITNLPLYQKVASVFHEATECIPPMNMETYDALTASMKLLGLLDPIVTYQDKIIDGRARYLACMETGIMPRFVEWQGDENALAFYIWSKNIARNHFTEGQLAGAFIECEDALNRYFAQVEE